MDLSPLIPIVAILSGLGWGWIGHKNRQLAHDKRASGDEIDQLRVENTKLHERLAVLERIATDSPNTLSREIETLR